MAYNLVPCDRVQGCLMAPSVREWLPGGLAWFILEVAEPAPTEEVKVNTTNPDSRVMKSRQGYVQGYNLQAVVSEDLIMVAIGVTQEANDVRQLEQTLEADGIEEQPKVYLADAGHWSEANIKPKVPRQSGECSGP